MPPISAEPALTQRRGGSLALPGREGLPRGVSKGRVGGACEAGGPWRRELLAARGELQRRSCHQTEPGQSLAPGSLGKVWDHL